MFSLVVGLFALCWLPYHLYFLIMYAAPHLAKSPVIRLEDVNGGNCQLPVGNVWCHCRSQLVFWGLTLPCILENVYS